MKYCKLSLLLLGLFLLSCSKDNVSQETENPEPLQKETLKGVFIDSPVAGLSYKTESKEGKTNSNGEYEYLDGETISFSVGKIQLGECFAGSKLSPLDIVGDDLNSIKVKNIAAFLQTLDKDKNSDNGITISQEALEFLPENQIDFSQSIFQWLGNFVANVNQNSLLDLMVVMPEEATVHLANSLDRAYDLKGLEAGPFYNIIESWETRSRNVLWIHDFDEEGKIIESNAYEKYPFKHILKYQYSNFNDNGYPTEFTANHIKNDGSDGFLLYFYLEYGNMAEISSIEYSPSSSHTNPYGWKVEKVNEKNQVTEVTTYQEGQASAKIEYDYNKFKSTILENIYELGAEEPYNSVTRQFTEFGELKEQMEKYSGGLERQRNYIYRNDYTLQKQIIEEKSSENPNLKEIWFYNESEFIIRQEKYHSEFLYEVVETDRDNSDWLTKTTIYQEEDNSYKIEYRDEDMHLYKTEYYDAEGNLITSEEN